MTDLRVTYYDREKTQMQDLNGTFLLIFYDKTNSKFQGRSSKRFLERLRDITTEDIRKFPDWFKRLRNKNRQLLDIVDSSFGLKLDDEPVEWGQENAYIPKWKASFLRT